MKVAIYKPKGYRQSQDMYVAQCFSPCFIFDPWLIVFVKYDYMLDCQECQIAFFFLSIALTVQ